MICQGGGTKIYFGSPVLSTWYLDSPFFRLRLAGGFKSLDFCLIQLINLMISGCARSACTLGYCLANSVSVNNAWICLWHARCMMTVTEPPLDLGIKWWASRSPGGICRSHKGHTGTSSIPTLISCNRAADCRRFTRPWTTNKTPMPDEEKLTARLSTSAEAIIWPSFRTTENPCSQKKGVLGRNRLFVYCRQFH